MNVRRSVKACGFVLILAPLLGLGLLSPARSEEPAVDPALMGITPDPSPEPRKRVYEKRQAEGTQAPNRFKEEAVLKSQYRLDGQSLEVDPD